MRRLLIATVIGLVAGGCTLLVSLDDLSGAGPGPGDASTADGRADGAADGATDSAPSDAGGRSPCTVAHLFCDDFDDAARPGPATGWASSGTDAGPLTLDTTTAASPPRSLFTIVTASSTPSTWVGSYLRQTFTMTKSIFHVECDVLLSAPSGKYDEFDPLMLEVPPAAGLNEEAVELTRYQAQATFQSYFGYPDGGGAAVDKPIALTTDTWHHVVIELVAAPPAKIAATLTLDGTSTTSTTLRSTTMATVTLGVGATFASDAVGATTHIDNVVVDER